MNYQITIWDYKAFTLRRETIQKNKPFAMALGREMVVETRDEDGKIVAGATYFGCPIRLADGTLDEMNYANMGITSIPKYIQRAELEWNHDTLRPLGDATIQITVPFDDHGTGLLTVRVKDQDLTAEQFDRVADACRQAAERLNQMSVMDKGSIPTGSP